MNMFEFKYAGELLGALSDEYRVRLLRRLRRSEESLEELESEANATKESFETQFGVLERAGLVTRKLRGGVEYARINPKMAGIVENYFEIRDVRGKMA